MSKKYNENFHENIFKEYAKLQNIDSPSNNDIQVLPHLIDFDKYFASIPNAIIINKVSFEKNYMSEIINKICDTTEENNFIATCECGELKGEFYEGILCKECNTVVKSSIVENITNDIWIEIPDDFKGGVIQPEIYMILNKWLTIGRNKMSYLNFILDKNSILPDDIAPYINGQGFNYLYENFDYVMDFFLNIFPKTAKHRDAFLIRLLLDKYKDVIWCKKLPILSSITQPVTKKSKSLKYVNKNLKYLLNAIVDLVDMRLMKRTTTLSKETIEKTIYEIYSSYISYIEYIQKKRLGSKFGILRQHIYGTRLHFSFRSVIVPIVDEHEGDELHIPWRIGINLFKYHVMNILINRMNYSMNAAYGKIIKSFYQYDPEIDQIFQLLIDEYPYKGFATIFNRNPSLRLSAIQLLFISKIKPCLKFNNILGENVHNEKNIQKYNNYPLFEDVINREQTMLRTYITDETIGISPLIVKGPNADFDGDEMNGVLIPELDEVKKFLILHPVNRMISPIDVKLDNDITLSPQSFVIFNEWLKDN